MRSHDASFARRTNRIRAILYALTIDRARPSSHAELHGERGQELIDGRTAVRAEKGGSVRGGAAPLAERMPGWQIVEGLAWMRANEPARHAALAEGVRDTPAAPKMLGARDGMCAPLLGPRVIRTSPEECHVVIGVPLAR